MTSPASGNAIPPRSESALEHTWDLELVYASPEAWETDFQRVDALLEPVLALQGKLTSPAAVASVFEADDALSRLAEKLSTYAHHREDEDTGNSKNQERQARVRAKMAQVMARTAWIAPEILSQPMETLEAWRDARELADYRYTLVKLIRQKEHTLSTSEETLLSRASEIFAAPRSIFGYLTNADMTFPDVRNEEGNPVPLSNGRFVPLMENRDRMVRRTAFEKFYGVYGSFENTLAASLSAAVKLHNFNAETRRFPSALAAALHPDNVPVAVYDNLIEATHEALPAFYDYIALRKEVLGLDDLNMWDVYVPIVPDYNVKVPWEKAKEWVRESTGPLGGEYAEGVRQALNERWIDVFENKGKRSGAYSGGCYDTPPYMLMNYQGTLDWVFTLAHELGHSMHSWLANRAQPYRYADYTIFVAEIASTTNEALLHHRLMKTQDDPRFQAFLLNHLCDAFRGTVFRQVMFAEFEKRIHEMDAGGEALTAARLNEVYYELVRKYHGPGIEPDERIAHEWSRIPHFYFNFYVYKYATGFCAAQVFFRQILESAEGRDRYLDFLRAGGSADPLDLVQMGGVDLSSTEVLKRSFATFRESVALLRGLLVG